MQLIVSVMTEEAGRLLALRQQVILTHNHGQGASKICCLNNVKNHHWVAGQMEGASADVSVNASELKRRWRAQQEDAHFPDEVGGFFAATCKSVLALDEKRRGSSLASIC